MATTVDCRWETAGQVHPARRDPAGAIVTPIQRFIAETPSRTHAVKAELP
jgi:hypothetical protein